MSEALWLLLGLQVKGWLRYLGRNLRTVRGAVLLLVGVGVFSVWLLAAYLGGHEGHTDSATVAKYGPAMLLAYCLVNVVFSPGERSVYFSPAEVQFLFAGPFSRREVLVYKIILALLVSLPLTLFLGAVVRVRNGWPPAMLAGLLFVSVFMQLFTMALGLLASAAGASLYSRARRVGAAAAAALAGLAVFEAGRRSGWQWHHLPEQVVTTAAWEVASWPLRSFFDVLTAQRLWPDLAVPSLVAVGVNVFLVGVILALDQRYQEASAAGSARRYAALLRMRGRSAGAEPVGPQRKARWSLPSLPYWGGVGPVLWRQSTSAFRTLGRMMLAVMVLGTVLSVWLTQNLVGESPRALVGGVFGLVAWLSVFVTALVPFDFRGDLDRIALLKSLPVAPWRLAVAQLLTPTLLLSVGQWLTLGVLAALSPDQWAVALACAACVPAFNFALIGLDNLLFLLFPVRLMASTPGDFQALGRNVLLSVGKLIGLGVLAVPAAVAAAAAYALTRSVALAVLGAAPVLFLGGAVLVPLVTLAYRRFDVGRDTPA